MNFIPCRLESHADALTVRLSADIVLPVPEERTTRYRGHAGKPLLFGIRPEHLTEVRALAHGGIGATLGAIADVVQPMGIETPVYTPHPHTPPIARPDPHRQPSVAGK